MVVADAVVTMLMVGAHGRGLERQVLIDVLGLGGGGVGVGVDIVAVVRVSVAEGRAVLREALVVERRVAIVVAARVVLMMVLHLHRCRHHLGSGDGAIIAHDSHWRRAGRRRVAQERVLFVLGVKLEDRIRGRFMSHVVVVVEIVVVARSNHRYRLVLGGGIPHVRGR